MVAVVAAAAAAGFLLVAAAVVDVVAVVDAAGLLLVAAVALVVNCSWMFVCCVAEMRPAVAAFASALVNELTIVGSVLLCLLTS